MMHRDDPCSGSRRHEARQHDRVVRVRHDEVGVARDVPEPSDEAKEIAGGSRTTGKEGAIGVEEVARVLRVQEARGELQLGCEGAFDPCRQGLCARAFELSDDRDDSHPARP
jgi:hypothetical protein